MPKSQQQQQQQQKTKQTTTKKQKPKQPPNCLNRVEAIIVLIVLNCVLFDARIYTATVFFITVVLYESRTIKALIRSMTKQH